MVLRFEPTGSGHPLFSAVKVVAFHPVDEALVVDGVYRDARVSDLYRSGDYRISVLQLAN